MCILLRMHFQAAVLCYTESDTGPGANFLDIPSDEGPVERMIAEHQCQEQ